MAWRPSSVCIRSRATLSHSSPGGNSGAAISASGGVLTHVHHIWTDSATCGCLAVYSATASRAGRPIRTQDQAPGDMMRKLFVLFAVGALVCAVAATTAFALTNNTVNYTVKAKKKGKASKAKPAPLSYEGILDVGTSDGKQPNVAPTTKLYFPKQIVQMAKYFPSCNAKAIDGQSSVPASCKKAVIGHGTASASGGAPGQPINPATTENLTVTAYNGAKGKQLLLVVNGSSPLQISNRVIVGKLGPGGGKFGYTVTFTVPADLQF